MLRLVLSMVIVTALLWSCAGAMPPAPEPSVTTSAADAGEQDGGALVQDAGGGGGAGGGTDGGGAADASVDLDVDGLDDRVEDALASTYLPFLSLAATDKCPLSGIVFRARPHPQNAALVHVIYDRLFERDCGLGGHVGDNEVFAVTIDPRKPFPEGLTAMKAIAHQNTLCGKTTACDRCGGTACTTTVVGGVAMPIVFSSTDKHGGYVSLSACNSTCIDSCVQSATSSNPPLKNAGEPGHPLTNNLTTDGFITAANGWTEQAAFNFDPWDTTKDFAGAGNVAEDLVDPAFLTAACPAP